MFIYVIFITILFMEGIIFDGKKLIPGGTNCKKSIDLDILFVALTLIVFAGIRNTRLGVDLWNYENSFHWRSDLSIIEVIASIDKERLYHVFAWIVSRFTHNFSCHLLIVATISIIPIVFFIRKYSKIRWLSVWLYVCMGFYTFGFSALRQSMAIGLTVFSLYFIEENSYKKAAFTFLIAFGFHMSAILCIPFFFLNKIKVNRTIMMAIPMLAAFVVLFRNQILFVGSKILRREYESIATGGKIWYIALIVMVIAGYLYRKHVWTEEQDWHLFLILSAAAIIMPVCFSNPVLFRANLYYTIYLCIYLPKLVCSLNTRNEKILVTTIIMIVSSYYFFYKALPGAHLETYQFVWQ